MINLVKNAIKFTNKGEISVRASYDLFSGSIIVHVRDTGVGIELNELHKLFTRFGKLQRTAHLNSGGIGLGLTICKQIIEQAEGKIEVASEGKDKGSLFVFSMKMEAVTDPQNLYMVTQSQEEQLELELPISSHQK